MFPAIRPRARKRLPRHTCRACEAHPAKFRYRGEVRADRDHELCFRCFRAVINSLRARSMAGRWPERKAA
jgi:hypothetical protein